MAIRPTLPRGARVVHPSARLCSRNGRCLTCLSFACRRGTRIGLSCPFGQVRSVWTLADRVVRGVGPLLELTTAAAVRLPREALFSFFTAAILRTSVNEMPFLPLHVARSFPLSIWDSLCYRQHGIPSSLGISSRCCISFRHVQPDHTWHKFLFPYMHFYCGQISGS